MKVFLILLTLAIISSCSTNDDTFKIINVNNAYQNKTIALSDMDSIILKETDNNSTIGLIHKVQCIDNSFIISSSGKLLKFSKDGNFITQIGKKGRANNEYIGINDFWIKDSTIFIYDINGYKILSYDIDANLKKAYSIEKTTKNGYIPAQIFLPLGNGYIGRCIYREPDRVPDIAYYDTDFSYAGRIGTKQRTNGLRLGYPLILSEDSNSALYWNQLGRDIYRITPDKKITKAYEINFNDRNYPPLSEDNDEYDILEKLQDSNWRERHSGFISYVCEKFHHFYFLYFDGFILNIGVLDNKSENYTNYAISSKPLNFLSYTSDEKNIYLFIESDQNTVIYAIPFELLNHN